MAPRRRQSARGPATRGVAAATWASASTAACGARTTSSPARGPG
eukprot:CAMPEP_0179337246 /NCGR_PEP_ID=MMETSP0797-20121207/67513_1 /TAXON_ID=47934 /ORGANISM="Dinophysis acuminata, Strain DAEP01" /LENGTH=43 /DNA_ID= /DNA_START= /DNA_END= /DNA_ORIENTATION=